LVVFQLGNLILNGIFGPGTVAAIALVIGLTVYLAKPNKSKPQLDVVIKKGGHMAC